MGDSSLLEQLSMRPYLLRAVKEWCVDQEQVPYLVVADSDACQLPKSLVVAGRVTFNISPRATPDCQITSTHIVFSTRIQGEVYRIVVPIGRINALYSRDTGLGLSFTPTEEEMASYSENLENASSPTKKPFLRVLK